MFETIQCVNIDEFAYAPAMAGDWKQKEVRDGTYDLDDLLDWWEMAEVKAENDRRRRDYIDYLERMRNR